MSYSTNEPNIRKLLKDCGEIKGVRIALGEDGKMKGFAHVEFEDAESAEKAMKFNGADLDGRNIKVDISEKLRDKRAEGGSW